MSVFPQENIIKASGRIYNYLSKFFKEKFRRWDNPHVSFKERQRENSASMISKEGTTEIKTTLCDSAGPSTSTYTHYNFIIPSYVHNTIEYYLHCKSDL